MSFFGNEIFAAALICIYLLNCFKQVSGSQCIVQIVFGRMELVITSSVIAGKKFVFVNPLLPYVPTFFTQPIVTGDVTDCRTILTAANEIPLIFQIATTLQLVLVAFIAPISLVWHNDAWFLATAALSYLNAIVLIHFVWTTRKSSGLPRQRINSVMFEAFLCLPYSINILRNYSLLNPIQHDVYSIFRCLPLESQKIYATNILMFLEDQLITSSPVVATHLSEDISYVKGLFND